MRQWYQSLLLYFKYISATGAAILSCLIFFAHLNASAPNGCHNAGYPVSFDKTIRASVAKHWPLEWQPYHCSWRAQLARESSLNTSTCFAANSAGAKCLAQILPSAAKDIAQHTGIINTRSDAKAAIMGGAWYMAKLGDAWREPRSTQCQMDLARAGYISGPGHIYRAQRVARADGQIARCFDGISNYLSTVITDDNAESVKEYVSSINALSDKMNGSGK